jgi:hypothetical protein
MQLDRIPGIYVEKVMQRGIARVTADLPIPGGRSQYFSKGVATESFTIEGFFSASNAITLARQLHELWENPDWSPTYFQFDQSENDNDGWFVLDQLRFPREHWQATFVPFSLTARKIGTLNSLRLAQFWDQWSSAAETYTGWSTLTANKLVALPYNATNVAWTVTGTRTTSDGSTQFLLNPTRTEIMFTSSSTIADWYSSECRVYDSVTAGDATEANWVQVFSPLHKFGGDLIFQNGLLRYKINAGVGTFYVYDSVTTPNAWATVGQLKTALTGNLDASIIHSEILKLTPDELQWREVRQNGVNPILLTFTLRRGAYHCRVKLQTFSLGIDTGTYVRLYSGSDATAYYSQLFNSQVSGAAGAGDLAQDTAANYECGYVTTRNVVSGFVLCDQPTKQPYDEGAAGHSLAESNTWAASTTRTFFVISFPQATSAFNLATGRSNALAIAQQALYHVDARQILIQRAYYV